MCDTLPTNHISLFNNPKRDILSKDEPDTAEKEADLKIESERFKTFKDFRSHLLPEDLVKVGLYYSNNKAKCAFCAIEIGFNQLGENLLDDHLKFSPSCPFARAKKGQRTLSTFLRALPADQDVCGNVDTFTDSVRFLSQIAHPYEHLNVRLESFENWPESSKQKPEVLAEAGFYYRGIGDKTVCFRCSGPLNNWQDDDDPWEQHAVWYPQCKFLLEEKGQEFIRQVQRKLKDGDSNEVQITDIVDEKKSEDKHVDEDKMCLICCNNQREVVFVPCGHDWTCIRCMKSLEDKKCPICRELIIRVRDL